MRGRGCLVTRAGYTTLITSFRGRTSSGMLHQVSRFLRECSRGRASSLGCRLVQSHHQGAASIARCRAPSFRLFSDEPPPSSRGPLKSALRDAYLGILRRRAFVLATGRNAVKYYLEAGVPKGAGAQRSHPELLFPRTSLSCADRRTQLGVGSMASRRKSSCWSRAAGSFVRKGFDVLLRALGALSPRERSRSAWSWLARVPRGPSSRASSPPRGYKVTSGWSSGWRAATSKPFSRRPMSPSIPLDSMVTGLPP